MNTLDILLNELQNRINNNEEPINNYEINKNNLIKLQNILYNHNIINKELDTSDLLIFSNEEVRDIMKIINNEKSDMLYKAYLVYKPLINMYNEIKDKFNNDFEAPQYKDAMKWLGELVNQINNYFNKYKDYDDEYINKLKEENILYKKYYGLFNSSSLLEPISDLDEFNNLLDNINLNDNEQAKIKKFVGVEHIKLLGNDDYSKEDVVEDVIVDEQETVKEDMTDNDINQEDIDNDTNEEIVEKDDDLVIEAKDILNKENKLIRSIDEKNFTAYLAGSIIEDDVKQVKYQIVSILLALDTEIEKYNNFKDDDAVVKITLSNIKEYLDVYHSLKHKID